MREEDQDGESTQTIGLIRNRNTRVHEIANATVGLPDFCRLLGLWAHIDGMKCVPFTSVNLNKDYAAARHRDSNNDGPSLVRAVGPFTGGELLYWPKDPLRMKMSDLDIAHAVECNVSHDFVLISGKCAHEVKPSQGSRYSLVFFTVDGYAGVTSKLPWGG